MTTVIWEGLAPLLTHLKFLQSTIHACWGKAIAYRAMAAVLKSDRNTGRQTLTKGHAAVNGQGSEGGFPCQSAHGDLHESMLPTAACEFKILAQKE